MVEGVVGYAVYALDAHGRICSWNPGAQQMTGYRASDVLGRHVSILYSEEDRAAELAEEHLDAARRDRRSESEGWYVRADGGRYYAVTSMTPIVATDGRVRGFSRVTRDETSQRAAEAALAIAHR